ncbi:Txe/YoeB family addiction module toxin [Mucilaginibacter sp. BJC16-A38]|uniref:Txe/YoeB family addiction module toxin n=1 Tax=Mucilaginibacter phenanthrenivorans TaxID=1234842 RepID=UPI0021575290|nr:Txe/YoeB family addiction module toxin [Mucilaginibacter phenanthrenivorans]MCR8556037.1 Txe/YoeB family addiction module toxin [Mucilaginibacter phenanthrenivorans]
MEVVYQPKALDDLKYWKKSGQKHLQIRILSLIQSIQETPFDGIGKPEPLKHNWSGMWSRRINNVHRIIYEIKENEIHIYSLKDHY